jgi:hypothetical protein
MSELSKSRGVVSYGCESNTLLEAFHLNSLIWANEEHLSRRNWILSGVPISTQSSA